MIVRGMNTCRKNQTSGVCPEVVGGVGIETQESAIV